MQPIVLGPNQPDTFYRGSGRIGRFRGTAEQTRPEDWIASTTGRFGHGTDGMTRLPDGSLLADAIAADPVAWLGPEHVARYGADPALLVKLLDAGQRLPLHVHPDRAFAAAHLASRHGKTEAWLVLEAVPDAAVHLGFTRDVGAAELAGWVRSQDVDSMLAATNRVPVAAGDTVLCPAGTPHAIGAGILVIELQEPSDWSVLLEWRGFGIGPDDALLGLPFDQAMACVTRQAARPGSLRGSPLSQPSGSLLPAAADPFFRAERAGGGARLPPGYAVLIVTGGTGELTPEAGNPVPVARGSTVLIPHSAGTCTLTGDLQAVRCLPPAG
jgi:mannose-6-phosphate isomerase